MPTKFIDWKNLHFFTTYEMSNRQSSKAKNPETGVFVPVSGFLDIQEIIYTQIIVRYNNFSCRAKI